MVKYITGLLGLFILNTTAIKAQSKFAATDEYVKQLGALENFNVATIADTISRNFPDKYSKARAIFYWIANNISIDPKATKANDKKNTLPEDVVRLRKTTPLGFSLLVQEMCSMANIRCLSVDGYLKNYAEDINNKADDINHSWNVVQLGQSPDQWFYVDAAKASGFLDRKMSSFTKLFTSEYFFADRALFNLDHYPDNEAWQLGGGPKSLREFYALPVINYASYKYGLRKPQPTGGYIKTKTRATVNFSFIYNDSINIKNIFLVMGEEKRQLKPEPMNFKQSGGVVSFSFQFKRSDIFPVKIVVDGNDLLEYMVEAED